MNNFSRSFLALCFSFGIIVSAVANVNRDSRSQYIVERSIDVAHQLCNNSDNDPTFIKIGYNITIPISLLQCMNEDYDIRLVTDVNVEDNVSVVKLFNNKNQHYKTFTVDLTTGEVNQIIIVDNIDGYTVFTVIDRYGENSGIFGKALYPMFVEIGLWLDGFIKET